MLDLSALAFRSLGLSLVPWILDLGSNWEKVLKQHIILASYFLEYFPKRFQHIRLDLVSIVRDKIPERASPRA